MKKYIFICTFGILGAMTRYAVKSLALFATLETFPINTLIINASGCLLFSLFLTLAYETRRISVNLRLGITAGFLSAYTTFSTFCKETVSLFANGLYANAAAYLILSIALGFFMSWAGAFLAKTFAIKMIRKIKKLYLNAIDQET